MSATPYGSDTSSASDGFVGRLARRLRRWIFLLHRWLGITLGLLMLLWTVTGIVMVYVPFPETTSAERMAGLTPLRMQGCCLPAPLPDEAQVYDAAIEMLDGQPVLRFEASTDGGVLALVDGSNPEIDSDMAGRVASAHIAHANGEATITSVDEIDRDQWTVYGQFRAHQPLYRVAFDDAPASELYISGVNGEVVQDTTGHERLWNWLGTVPHWLYFTALRERQALWYNLVVYASLLGTFLTITGIYVGLRQYKGRGRGSPYRGWAWVHHMSGLVFGVLALTWVFSGLASMQPWGWLEGEGVGEFDYRLKGGRLAGRDLNELIESAAQRSPDSVVRIELQEQAGRAVAIMSDAAGNRWRARITDLTADVPDTNELNALAMRASDGALASAELLSKPDGYYYAFHTDVTLPVYRAIAADDGDTHIYIDPRTGELLTGFDSAARQFRWWHLALHRLDFASLLRAPAARDFIVVPLLLGLTLITSAGVYLGVRRLRRMRG